MKNCWCCQLRTACLVFGYLLLVWRIGAIGNDCYSIVTEMGENSTYTYTTQELNELRDAFIKLGPMTKLISIDNHITFINLFLDICTVIVASLLIFGTLNRKSRFIIPSLVFFPLDTLVQIIFVFVLVANLGFLHPFTMFLSIKFILGISFNFFIWLCVFSYWQGIKEQLVDQEDGPGREKYTL
eukprot:GFUD01032338.1.p1 GENE.GFUD01032338.1~~GFUD01032338.1.p1  ORF type:complete len:184 (+),score=24.22 GFUD01032338.1:130-681(+)